MKYSIQKEKKYHLIRIDESKVDATVSPDLKQVFTSEENASPRNWIFDLKEVKYIDSSGLSAILIGNRVARDVQGEFVLVGVSEHVMKLIKISQLDKVLTILPTVEEAVDYVFMTEIEKEMNDESEGGVS
ncbi:MAG: STAS domain-containing protein [Thermonemataceae bacterium]